MAKIITFGRTNVRWQRVVGYYGLVWHGTARFGTVVSHPHYVAADSLICWTPQING